MKRTAATAVNRLGFFDAYAFLKRMYVGSQVVIMMYHRVSPYDEGWSLRPLNPRIFEEQIRYFSRSYAILSLDELARYLRRGESPPKKAVVITFDDGYRDNYLHAFPILRKYRAPATIFLITGHIGGGELFWFDKVRYIVHHTDVKRLELEELGSYRLESASERAVEGATIVEKLIGLPYDRKNFLIRKLFDISGVEVPADLANQLILSWQEVLEMSRAGIQFGAHSVTHPALDKLPTARAEWEISQSKRDIERRLGVEVTSFAYPNGSFHRQIVKCVKNSGFSCAVSGDPMWITPGADPYRLNRVGVAEDPDRTKVSFCGLWGDLQRILGRKNGDWDRC